jgi:DNA-binding Lrp family transcriptional regulator
MGVYLDLIDMAREGGDVLGPLIEAAVFEANVADFVEGHHSAGELWALVGPAPAEAMRPASVNAVAASLRLPFETVRRRVAALVRQGRLVRDRDGLGVAPEWLARPAARELSRRRYARLQRIHRDIVERLGPAALELPPGPAPPSGAPPLLFTDHLANGYMLRMAEIMTAELGDPFVGFVLLNLVRANIRHLPLEDPSFARQSVAARRPARPSPLAKTLGVAPETLRRHVRLLEGEGFFVRTEDGGMLLDDQMFRSRLAHVLIGVGVASIRGILGEMAQAGLLPAAGEPRPHDGAPGALES